MKKKDETRYFVTSVASVPVYKVASKTEMYRMARSSSRLIQMSIDLNGGPARIVQFFYPDTLELCPAEEDIYRRAKGQEALESWIEREGVEKCRRTVEETARLLGL